MIQQRQHGIRVRREWSMPGENISQLDAVPNALLTDFFPVVQAGETQRETLAQIQTLFGITPTPTFASVAFSTPAGIIGTTTNNNANAGSVGEFITSNVPFASAIPLTTTVNANVTSISLTAGDWDVFGSIFLSTTGSIVSCAVWSNIVSATLPDGSMVTGITFAPGLANGGFSILTNRLSLAVTTTVFLSVQTTFTTGTANASGTISARRVR
jgi:hypothetical protein